MVPSHRFSLPTHSPLVSVIIPTYNRALALNRCLESLCAQTFGNFEVIIADDGSTDNTSEVVDRFSLRLSILYLRISNSGGPARPRNLAVSRSSGKYIAFLDSDDSWAPTKLEVCLKLLQNGADLVYHDAYIKGHSFLPFRARSIPSRQVSVPVYEHLLANGNSIFNSSVVVSRSLLEKALPIDESFDLIAAEDFDLWLRLAQYSDLFLSIPRPLLCYQVSVDSISSFTRKYRYTKYICVKHGLTSVPPAGLPDWALANLATSSFRLRLYSESCTYFWSLALRSVGQYRMIKFLVMTAATKLLACFSF